MASNTLSRLYCWQPAQVHYHRRSTTGCYDEISKSKSVEHCGMCNTHRKMNSTKVQNPRRKMQVALLAEPKTPPGVERVYIILYMSTSNEMWWLFCTYHEALLCDCTVLYTASAIRYTCAYKFTARVQSRA